MINTALISTREMYTSVYFIFNSLGVQKSLILSTLLDKHSTNVDMKDIYVGVFIFNSLGVQYGLILLNKIRRVHVLFGELYSGSAI